MTMPDPPKGLRAAGQRLWQAIQHEYVIDDVAGLELLRKACQHEDTAADLESSIASDGAVYRNRFDEPATHPAVSQLRAERKAVCGCLRQLGIDLEQPKPVGRPPGT